MQTPSTHGTATGAQQEYGETKGRRQKNSAEKPRHGRGQESRWGRGRLRLTESLPRCFSWTMAPAPAAIAWEEKMPGKAPSFFS